MTARRSWLLRATAFALALAFPLLLGACGGDDEATTTTAADAPGHSQSDSSSSEGGEGGDQSSEGGSGETLTDPRGERPPRPVEKLEVPKVPKGGDDSIQTYGEEAGEEQSAVIAEAVRGFFKAQANRRWADVCFYLSSGVKEQLTQAASQSPESIPTDCPSLLKQMGQGVPRSARKRLAKVRVGSVRVDGGHGFVLYIGAGHKWYAVPVSEEDTGWKVGLMAGTPIYSG
jgi:hypothetical protein